MAEAKKETKVEVVDLEDGSKGEFAGKRKMNKVLQFNETTGAFEALRVEFRSGAVRVYPRVESLAAKFEAHGYSQKYGDETAGVEDIDDMVQGMDDLHEQVAKGEWRQRSEGGGSAAGSSVVIQALMLKTGQPLQAVKDFMTGLLAKYQASDANFTKRDLYASFKASDTLKPFVQQVEDAKAKKAKKLVDVSGAMDGLPSAAA